jgi:hypothetical protein
LISHSLRATLIMMMNRRRFRKGNAGENTVGGAAEGRAMHLCYRSTSRTAGLRGRWGSDRMPSAMQVPPEDPTAAKEQA